MKIKNIFLILATLCIIVSCADEDSIRIPDFQYGAVPDFSKIDGTDGVIPADDPASLSARFSLDIVTKGNANSAKIYITYNGMDTMLLEQIFTFPADFELTFQKLIEIYPTKSVADFLAGDDVTLFVDEIEMSDGRVIKNQYEYLVQDTTDAGADTLVGITAPIMNQSTAGLNGGIWNYDLTYFVACPSALEGTYNLTFTGEGGGGFDFLEPYTATFEGVTWTKVSDIEYRVSNCFGGLMQSYYGAFGGGIVNGTFIDLCGNVVGGMLNDGWNPLTVTSGAVEADGTIRISIENPWGDHGELVYTPAN